MAAANPGRRAAQADAEKQQPIKLCLYVAGQTSRSKAAIENLKRICTDHLNEVYEVEVVDLVKNPRLASEHQIVAIPTLVRELPEPIKKIIGDLSNVERVLVGLDLRHASRN